MEYIKVSEAAKKWDISPRRVRLLCSQNKIDGAVQEGKLYMIPANAEKPADERTKESKILQQSAHSLLFQRVNEKQEKLKRIRPLSLGEINKLRDDFLSEFLYNSCAISGGTLSQREVSLILDDIVIDQRPLKFHLEVVGAKNVYLYAEQNISERDFFSESTILTLHSILMVNNPIDRGTYRKIPLRKLSSHGETVDPSNIQKSLKELLKTNEKRKKELHLVERLALFHLDFEGIHPFIEGTGQLNRLLLNLQLLEEEQPLIPFVFQDRKKYFDAFNIYFEDKNPDPMIELIGSYMENSLDFYLNIFEKH